LDSIHLLGNLSRWGQTCAYERYYYSIVKQLESGTQYNNCLSHAPQLCLHMGP